MYKALKRVQEEKSPIKDWFKVLCSGVLSGNGLKTRINL